MAVSQPSFGIRHLTVVPTNFEPTEESDEAGDATVDSKADTVDGGIDRE